MHKTNERMMAETAPIATPVANHGITVEETSYW